MEGLQAMFERQSTLTKEIERINTNFRKDSASRKTSEYLLSRLGALDKCWKEFEDNHNKLFDFADDQYEYFSKNIYGYMKDYYFKTKEMISSYKEPKLPSFSLPAFEEYSHQGDDLLSQQETNFRALNRLINRISIQDLEEKWELQDELQTLQNLWKVIDTLHLRLDNQLNGSNDAYEAKFLQIEKRYLHIKRELNKKLNSTAHLEQATPKLEVPTFFGNYTQWPTFFDLFVETIHNNKCLSKAQKMQHLKAKVKGEAEGLIQHLNISAENYETAWDILTHRYNNPQILFATQMDIFLNQSQITKQSSYQAFKKLHDTTAQCINAIRNLGIDIATWDPILVHLLSKKLDDETRTDFMESRDSPRDLASYSEFLHYLENKFLAREPTGQKEKPAPPEFYRSNLHHPKPANQTYPASRNTSFYKKYQSNAINSRRNCPICKTSHDLFQCKRFLSQSADAKLRTLTKFNICRNCLYKHYDNKCMSSKRCKECSGEHNSIIHDAITMSQSQQQPSTSDSALTSQNNHNVNYVASENEEVLLTTVALKIRASDGSYMQFRALLDQGSQISLISENAAQILGLKRQHYQAAVSGIGSTQKQSKGLVSLDCASIYNDYHFTTEALVVSRVINNLPNASFRKQSWPHLSHTRLADPEYNVSRPIDLLLDASVYSDIIMSGLIKGPVQAPIAQQTKLGWILSGNVKTFACHVVINESNNIAKFREVEDIHDPSTSLSVAEQYFEHEMGATKSRPVGEELQPEQINAPLELEDPESEPQISNTPHTKQHSKISKISDPLGWLSPLTIRAKILFQTTWTANLSWDEELPANISLEWQKLRSDLGNIVRIYHIPRYLITADHKGERTPKLVTVKTKVARIKKPITLPGRELLSALLLSQLVDFLRALSSEHIEIFAWTDSMVVLSWLRGDTSKWKHLIANRVHEISQIMTSDNPSDFATRGLTSEDISRHRLWWEGPEWLLTFNSDHITTTEYACPTEERKKPTVHTALCQTQSALIIKLLNKYSSLSKVLRTLTWVLHFIASLCNTTSHARSALTVVDLQTALYIIIRYSQNIDFCEDINHLRKRGFVRNSSKLSCLRPFLDEHGILRVGGRLEQANITYAAKHPIIISPGSRLAQLLIEQTHISTLHGGPRLTLSFIQEKYWLISRINCVEKQLRLCLRCRKYSQELYQQLMADLSKPTNTPSQQFINMGVAFTGHVETKSAQKGRYQSKFSMKTLFTSALLLFMIKISPSSQQSTLAYNITPLDSQQNLFFDRVSELQHIKDEWKLIVFYNMSSYWSGFTNLEIYARHLEKNMSEHVPTTTKNAVHSYHITICNMS